MSKLTSINIQPIKQGSESHNYRLKNLDYVREDLSHKNESWESDSVRNRRKEIEQNYLKNIGQKMQKKATPVREGVVVISEDTTMEELKKLADKFEECFGIKTFQIHIHRDEGHSKAKEWKPNLHAHLVFDWTDKNGKTLKLNRYDMEEMQTITAFELGMNRGKSSSKKHLTAIQYKNLKEIEVLKSIYEEEIEVKEKIKSMYSSRDEVRDLYLDLTEKNKMLREFNAKLYNNAKNMALEKKLLSDEIKMRKKGLEWLKTQEKAEKEKRESIRKLKL